jgi:NADPH:quinone reductase-like Zn-dependent oxidoreductase
MLASPVNPSDLMYVAGRYGVKPATPATPGFEGVGVVEANGGGLLGWLRKGKRVAVLNDRIGNWAEYTVAPARRVIPVPADIPDDQAAAFFVNPATAWVITRSVLRVPPGSWLLQTAAGSALGKMVIRLGRRFGFRTLNVVRRREQVDELKQLGADSVIVEADGPLSDQVRAATGDPGVPFAMDSVGGDTGRQVVESLAAGGRAILYGLLSGQPVTIDPRFLITGSKRVEGFWLADHMRRLSIPKTLLLIRRVRGLMRVGVLTSDIAASYPLDRVRDAVRHAAAPGKGGKVLLRISDR